MNRANGEVDERTIAKPLQQILSDLEADALCLAQFANRAEEQARDARRQADLARERVDQLRRELIGSIDADLEGVSMPAVVGTDVSSEVNLPGSLEADPGHLLMEAFQNASERAAVLTALGNHAVLPLTEVLEACGISRDVGDRLREEGVLEPILVNDTKNPRLYISVGAWRDFIRRRKVAPPPSRSKLSKAKRKTKAK